MTILTIILSVAVLISPIADPSVSPNEYDEMHGYLSEYSEAPTIGTVNYRIHTSKQLPEDAWHRYDTFIAVHDCDLIGREGWLHIPAENLKLKAVVFDCSGDVETSQWMKDNNILGEVDYYTAKRYNVTSQMATLQLPKESNYDLTDRERTYETLWASFIGRFVQYAGQYAGILS